MKDLTDDKINKAIELLRVSGYRVFKIPVGWQKLEYPDEEEDGETCNKYKWGDCECKGECKRGLKQ